MEPAQPITTPPAVGMIMRVAHITSHGILVVRPDSNSYGTSHTMEFPLPLPFVRRADELWDRYPRRDSTGRRLYRPDPQGRQASRPAGAAIDQVRIRHQPADGRSVSRSLIRCNSSLR